MSLYTLTMRHPEPISTGKGELDHCQFRPWLASSSSGWAEKNLVSILMEHVPGLGYVTADWLSCQDINQAEWLLYFKIFSPDWIFCSGSFCQSGKPPAPNTLHQGKIAGVRGHRRTSLSLARGITVVFPHTKGAAENKA